MEINPSNVSVIIRKTASEDLFALDLYVSKDEENVTSLSEHRQKPVCLVVCW